MNRSSTLLGENFRAIFFDFGDTLIFNNQTFPEAMYKICRSFDLDITFERLSAVIKMADIAVLQKEKLSATTAKRYKSYRVKYYKYILNMLGYQGLSQTHAIYFHETIDYYIDSYLHPETNYVLSSLRDHGYKLGIVSNFSHALPTICDKLNLTEKVDFITYSDAVGYEKPLPYIFEDALDKARVSPEETLHVGDSYVADILGA